MSRPEKPVPGANIDTLLKALPVRAEHAARVAQLRVEVAELVKDRDSWKREWELYAHSWLRRLGGKVFRKRHHIDALAMTTEHQRIGFERALAAGLIGEAYGSGPIATTPGGDLLEQAARVAECAFDDRPRSRVGHPSHMDWEDGYREGTQASAAAIHALSARNQTDDGEVR